MIIKYSWREKKKISIHKQNKTELKEKFFFFLWMVQTKIKKKNEEYCSGKIMSLYFSIFISIIFLYAKFQIQEL